MCDFSPYPWPHDKILYNNYSSDPALYRFELGKVSQGDTVQVFYDTAFLARPDFSMPAASTRDTLEAFQTVEIFNADSTILLGWQIRFFKRYNTCISGVYEDLQVLVGLETDSLAIEIADPKEVWPTIPAEQGGNPASRNQIGTVITLFSGNSPVKNQDVTVTAQIILPSGGHDHLIQPPLNTRGVFATVGLNPETGNGTITAQTDTNGILLLNYTTPVYAGRMEFTAQTIIDSDTILARDTLTIEVPILVHLPDNPTNYIKIGGTCNHHGPRNDSSFLNCRTSDNNHWGQSLTVAFLNFIAIQYKTQFPDDEILQINDISLPSGGKLDINAQWTGNNNHQYHRLGLDVDVRSLTIPDGDEFHDINGNGQHDLGEPLTVDVNGNGVYDRNREEFEDICLDHGVIEVDLENTPEHYHLYFWDPPDN